MADVLTIKLNEINILKDEASYEKSVIDKMLVYAKNVVKTTGASSVTPFVKNPTGVYAQPSREILSIDGVTYGGNVPGIGSRITVGADLEYNVLMSTPYLWNEMGGIPDYPYAPENALALWNKHKDNDRWLILYFVNYQFDTRNQDAAHGTLLTIPDRIKHLEIIQQEITAKEDDYKTTKENIEAGAKINVDQEKAKAINSINNAKNIQSLVTVVIIAAIAFLGFKLLFSK